MKNFIVNPIGEVVTYQGQPAVRLYEEYIPALKELEHFSHVDVLWWFDGCDHQKGRSVLQVEAPYKQSPALMGVFATRSPERPNPLALSVTQIIRILPGEGILQTGYLDAEEGSPVIDLKPYTPSLDRVENPVVPGWCSDWPVSLEESAEFDWQKVFHF